MQFKAITNSPSVRPLSNVVLNRSTVVSRFIPDHAISDNNTASMCWEGGDNTTSRDSLNIETFRRPQDSIAHAILLLLLLGTSTAVVWICGILVNEVVADLMSVNAYELVKILSGIP